MAEKRKADSSQGLMGMIQQQLSDMPSQSKKPRQAEKNMGTDPLQTLFNRLKEIRDDFHKRGDMGGCNVEIEAKLGLIVSSDTGGRTGPFTPGAGAIEMLPGVMKGKKFVSGVSRRDFESFRKLQDVPALAEKIAKKTHAYTYNDDQRIQTDEEGNVILEMKTRELEFQIHLPACPYDCRITVSIEKPLEQKESLAVKDGWHSHRVKDRTSFVDLKARQGHSKASQWQADFTRVATTTQRDPTAEETFEVELELKAEECKTWIQASDAEEAKQKTGDIARDLWNRVSQMMPREQTAGKLVEVRDYAVEEAAQRACIACFDSAEAVNAVKYDFPGTMPIGFSRKSIEKVQRESYMVSEKTDGIRYLLTCVASPEAGKPPVAVLLDRKFKAWTMEGMEEIGAALGVGTVLDGEIVRNRSWKRDIFMTFDALSCGDRSVVRDELKKRLAYLQDFISSKYLKYLASKGEQGVHARMKVMPIVMKHWYPAHHITEVTRHISFEGPDRVYLERGSDGRPLPALKRHHKSDGLIFAPNLPYHRGTDFNYMKWKWHDTITLDFEVRRAPYSYLGIEASFSAQGADRVDFTDHIHLGKEEKYRLLGDLGNQSSLITEWEYCAEQGAWIYKMPRPDKKKPNFSRTVLATIMEIAEGMDIEELEYRLSFRNPEDDDWTYQIDKKRKEILSTRLQSNGSHH